MKKIVDLLKNSKFKKITSIIFEILFISLVLIFISQNVLNDELVNLDEMWNFSFAKNIADGKIPYKDFNMIITPGTAMFAAVFLKLIANELIVYRILTIIFSTIFIYLIYWALKKLKLSKCIGMVLCILLFQQLSIVFRFDYNLMIILFDILILNLEIKLYHKAKEDKKSLLSFDVKYDFLIGLIAGLGICTKQTIGILISCACLLYKIVLIRNKKDLKEYLKIFLVRLSGILIPVIILSIYFTCNHIWKDFADYTIFGINGFTNSSNYKKLFDFNLYYKITAAIVPIVIIYMIVNSIYYLIRKNKIVLKKKNNYIEYSSNLFILCVYSICGIVLAYPIADKSHFILGSIASLISVAYIVNTIIFVMIKQVKSKNKNKNNLFDALNKLFNAVLFAITVFFMGLIIVNSSTSLNEVIKSILPYDKINHFKYVRTQSMEYYKYNNSIGNYIKNKEAEGYTVYMISPDAVMYMIPIDHCNKNYDLCLKGNTGKNTEEDLIKDLDSKEKLCVLIYANGIKDNWQAYLNLKEHIKTTMNFKQNVILYDVYQND